MVNELFLPPSSLLIYNILSNNISNRIPPFLILFLIFLILIAIICILVYNQREKEYMATEYAQNTNKTRREVLSDKGFRGEYELYLQTTKQMEDQTYWLFNVYVPRSNGRTTEIDAILFHSSGIYIIESKNYGGWIYGSEYQERWTQCLKPGTYAPVQKYSFYNPTRQNQFHVECFRTWLGKEYNDVPIYSIILFGDDCTLKEIHLTSNFHIVDYQYNFPSIVKKIASTTSFSNMEYVKKIYDITHPLSQTDSTTKEKHIDDIQKNLNQPTYKVQTLYSPTATPPSPAADTLGPCPLCGGTLLTRIAKKGPHPGTRFIGCSNFPSCRYTKNIDEEHT